MTAFDEDDRTYGLLFDVRRSVRYHMRRRRFYEGWNTVTVALAVIGGSSAAGAFFSKLDDATWVPAVVAAVVAVVGAIDMAVGTARHASHHGDLARQFIWLEARFSHGRALSDDEHESLTTDRLRIEATEPPVLRLLDMLCYFETMRALGDPKPHRRVPRWRLFLAHILSQTEYALVLAKEVNAAHERT
ncbi:MAG: hypothetical protein OXK82_08055 [Deltaproteobacteria bacterium]|nr:hypothetical protein [Deltaproteobacteria bacterium]